MPRAVNAATADLIQRFEGLHRRLPDGRIGPYLCPAAVWTIGWGSTLAADGRPVTRDTAPLTVAECDALFRRDLARFSAAVERLVRVPLADNQFGALVSFAHNLGPGRLAASTLLRRVNDAMWTEAGAEFGRWTMAGGQRLQGLVLRREAERALFLAPDPQPEIPAAPAPATSGAVGRFMAAFDSARKA
jgi:lysozyme